MHFTAFLMTADEFQTSRIPDLFVHCNIIVILYISFMTEALSYRNQSINLFRKSMDWFLYDRDLPYERELRIFFSHVL